MIILCFLIMAIAVYATVGGGGGGSYEYQGVKKLVKKIIKNRKF